jgi:hypothetical protein
MTAYTSYQGVAAVGDYSAETTAGAAIDILLALLPDVDASLDSGTGAGANGGAGAGFLDEMSPAAVVQLRVELEAMKDTVDLFDAPA